MASSKSLTAGSKAAVSSRAGEGFGARKRAREMTKEDSAVMLEGRVNGEEREVVEDRTKRR